MSHQPRSRRRLDRRPCSGRSLPAPDGGAEVAAILGTKPPSSDSPAHEPPGRDPRLPVAGRLCAAATVRQHRREARWISASLVSRRPSISPPAFRRKDALAGRGRRRPPRLASSSSTRPSTHSREVLADDARAAAHAAEAAVQRGDDLGPLHGVPVGVKDQMNVTGARVTFGTHLLADYVATEDAPVVVGLRRAGAIVVGMTTMPEFGWQGHQLESALRDDPQPMGPGALGGRVERRERRGRRGRAGAAGRRARTGPARCGCRPASAASSA